MDYRAALQTILDSSPPEIFPGQNEEIRKMTMAAGCDICEHVPTLIKYGRQSRRITEMGVRFGWSTRSFLFSRPQSLLSIDKFDWDSTHQSGLTREPGNSKFRDYKEKYLGSVEFSYQKGDTTKIPAIDRTDLLFIDTFHHRDCLRMELDKHGNQSDKWIVLHDTETFGQQGQADDSRLFFDQITTNEFGTGLWSAIKPWLDENKHWVIEEVFRNNNGLTILRRK
jgi:hypothetical protein